MTDYIRTDECQDVLASLEHCALSLKQAQRSDRSWKWVVLSLHSALQGAMVCHLSGTAQLGALTKNCAEEWLEWRERDHRGEITWIQEGVDEFGVPTRRIENKKDQPPENFVAPAGKLFKRLSCTSLRIEGECGGIISITEKQRESFTLLHKRRNTFTHFSPKGWSIEINFVEDIIDDILDVLCSILDDQWPFRHMPDEDKSALRSRIEEIRSIASQGRTLRVASGRDPSDAEPIR